VKNLRRPSLYWSAPSHLFISTGCLAAEGKNRSFIFVREAVNTCRRSGELWRNHAKETMTMFVIIYKNRKELRRYDMNGRFKMQGGKNWILPK
jgi:hypothetical protein